jgi:hypothetical protein
MSVPCCHMPLRAALHNHERTDCASASAARYVSLSQTAVHHSFLCVHGAPPGAAHLQREIVCGGTGTAAAAMAPGPEGAWEEGKGDDASVLVAFEELVLDSAAFDVLFEPCQHFGVVGLRRTTDSEMRSLFKGDSKVSPTIDSTRP